MMQNAEILRFFSRLEKAGSEILGSGNNVSIAARNAVEHPSLATYAKAQEELALLPEKLREEVLYQLHSEMRNDLEAIWKNLPNSSTSKN